MCIHIFPIARTFFLLFWLKEVSWLNHWKTPTHHSLLFLSNLIIVNAHKQRIFFTTACMHSCHSKWEPFVWLRAIQCIFLWYIIHFLNKILLDHILIKYLNCNKFLTILENLNWMKCYQNKIQVNKVRF